MLGTGIASYLQTPHNWMAEMFSLLARWVLNSKTQLQYSTLH